MTITATVPKKGYTATGATGDFVYDFKISAVTDILVYYDGALLVSGYSVSGAGSPTGGLVTISPVPPAGVRILLLRNTTRDQSTDWSPNDPDPAESKEQAFDKSMSIDQEQDEILSRTPKYKVTDAITQTVIETPVTGQFLRHKDSLGNIDSAALATSGSIGVPVSFAQGGTGASYASRDELLLGLNASQWKKGSDLLAGATVTLPNPLTGNYFTINGSTGITAFSIAGVAIGTVVTIDFVGNPTITHSASLRLIGNVNYPVVSGGRSVFLYAGANEWYEIHRLPAVVATQTTKFWRGDGSWQDPIGPIVGGIMMYAGSVAPSGWALCNGAAYSRTTYAAAFAVMGTTYGPGDGSTTFNVPNFAGRVPAGYDITQAEFNNLGGTGGENSHTLSEAEMPVHSHITIIGVSTIGAGANWAGASAPFENRPTSNAGSGGPHNNLQPYVVVNYIIRMV